MAQLYRLLWLSYWVAFVWSSIAYLPEQVGAPGKALSREAYMALIGGLGAFVTLLCGPLTMAHLRARASGGVNLPHAQHWFEGERRQASLDRLEPFMLTLSLLLIGLFAGLHGIEIWNALHAPARLAEAWVMLPIGLNLLAGGIWTWRLLRAFGPPPPESSAPQLPGARRKPQSFHGQP